MVTTGFSNQFTFTPQNHTLKFGFGASKNGGTNIVGARTTSGCSSSPGTGHSSRRTRHLAQAVPHAVGTCSTAWTTGAPTSSSPTSGRPQQADAEPGSMRTTTST